MTETNQDDLVETSNVENHEMPEDAKLSEDSKVVPEHVEPPAPTPTGLTRLEKKNIGLLVLAWCCAQSCFTLVTSTGAVAIVSVGGSPALGPFVVAFAFMGIALVSATTSHWIFAIYGRKIGFFWGAVLGVVGSIVGGLGLIFTSPAIVLIAQILLGFGGGIGLYLRFAALEVVPPEYASRAVTWVLAGGCIAAFMGPEVAQATVGIFGDDENLTYLGAFVAKAGFFTLQGICTGFIEFPDHKPPQDNADETSSKQLEDEEEGMGQASEDDESAKEESGMKETSGHEKGSIGEILEVLKSREFIFPLLAAILSWSIWVMPMSVFRIPMRELDYGERQSLLVIEINTLARYLPGFWSGLFIRSHGVVQASVIAVVCFAIGPGILMTAQDNNSSVAAWHVGAVFIGIGWNFGFSSATVWSTKAYQNHMHLKAQIQAANECGIFLISGIVLFSAGYIYDDWGGGGIEGWRLLNGVLFALVLCYGLTIVVAMKDTATNAKKTEVMSPQESAEDVSEDGSS